MPKRSPLVQKGKFKGLAENVAKPIGDAVRVGTEADFHDCWPWRGMTVGNRDTGLLPYGSAKTWTSTETLVHRIVYEWKYGRIPDGLKVLHLCNFSLCCNPRHMRLGTQRENMQHMAASRRAADVKGVKNPKRILEPDRVAQIRKAYATGETARSIASRMSLERGTVCAVLLRNPQDRSRYKFWPDAGGPMRPAELRRKPHDKFGPHVESMRCSYLGGATINQLAEQWDATPGTVQKILLGLTHADRRGPTFEAPLRWGISLKGLPKRSPLAVASEVRLAYAEGRTVNQLAKSHQVTSATIVRILSGRNHGSAGGPIFSGPFHYSDLRLRPKQSGPRFVVRTQTVESEERFKGLPSSVARKIGPPVNRDHAMNFTGCWPWTGHKKAGYGGGRKAAHIMLYEWANGPVAPGLIVMHLCNQRDCCNPGHLRAGTYTENMRYMADSGRASRLSGMNSPGSRFRPAEVLAIRTQFGSGKPLSTIALEMGLTYSDIDHLVLYDRTGGYYRFWREVGGPTKPTKNGRKYS